jgi:hypothetical protein
VVHFLESDYPDAARATVAGLVGRAVAEAGVDRLVVSGGLPAACEYGAVVPTTSILHGDLIGPTEVDQTPAGAALLCFLNGVPSALFAGRQQVHFSDVGDVAAAHVSAGESAAEREFYAAAGDALTAIEWAHLLSRVTGLPVVERYVPTPFGTPLAHAVDVLAQMTGVQRRSPRRIERRHEACELSAGMRAAHAIRVQTTLLELSVRQATAWCARSGLITDESRLAIVQSALVRASHDAVQSARQGADSVPLPL